MPDLQTAIDESPTTPIKNRKQSLFFGF